MRLNLLLIGVIFMIVVMPMAMASSLLERSFVYVSESGTTVVLSPFGAVTSMEDDPDYNKELCDDALWDDELGCCGDDPEEDCGEITEDGRKICWSNADSTQWNLDDAYDYPGKVIRVGCGDYEVLSTGKEWISCSAEDTSPSNCLFSMSDTSNAHVAKCGIYEHNLMCTPEEGYDLKCQVKIGCEGDEVEIMQMSDPYNGHASLRESISGAREFKVCCWAGNSTSGNILRPSGSHNVDVVELEYESNSHVSYGGEFSRKVRLSSNDPVLDNFTCNAPTLVGSNPQIIPSKKIASFGQNILSKALNDNDWIFKHSYGKGCVLSYTNDVDGHAGACGMHDKSIVCSADGYDFSCSLRRKCTSNETSIGGLRNSANSHIWKGANNENYQICCSALDENGHNVLGSGSYTYDVIGVSKSADGHIDTGSATEIVIQSTADIGLTCTTKQIETRPYFRGKILPRGDIDLEHDYICYSKAGISSIKECSFPEEQVNDDYAIPGDSLTADDRKYFCTGDVWTDEEDYSSDVCDFFWIGNTTTEGLCCGDDYQEYFNIDTVEDGENPNYACWNSTEIENYYSPYYINETGFEIGMEEMVNINGSFYSCELKADSPFWLLQDISTGGDLLSQDRNVSYCTVKGDVFCDYHTDIDGNVIGYWKRIKERISDWPEDTTEAYLATGLDGELGCCPTGFCLSDGSCVSGRMEDLESGDYTIEGDKMCYLGTWVDAESRLKEDWDGEEGFCEGDKCVIKDITEYGFDMCVDDGTYVSDHLCDKGEWTTRTSKVANELMRYVSADDDFVIYCDEPSDVFAYLEYTVGPVGEAGIQTILSQDTCISDELYYVPAGADPGDYPHLWYGGADYVGLEADIPCVPSACVLRLREGQPDEKVLFGMPFNNVVPGGVSIEDYLANIDRNFDVSDEDNILIYHVRQPQPGAIPTLLGSVTNFISWIYQMFFGVENYIEFEKDIQQIYMARTSDGKEIFSSVEDANWNGDKTMLASYVCFDDLEPIVPEYVDYYRYDDEVQYLYTGADFAIDDNWRNLTAMLRPKSTGVVCEYTKDMCFDNDGGRDYVHAGTVTAIEDEGSPVTYPDTCDENGLLIEQYCQGNQRTFETVSCGEGRVCDIDKCIETLIPPDTDGGEDGDGVTPPVVITDADLKLDTVRLEGTVVYDCISNTPMRQATIFAKVKNIGANPSGSYTLEFYADSILKCTMSGESLSSQQTSGWITCEGTFFSMDASHTIRVKVANLDENNANNAKTIERVVTGMVDPC